MNKQEIIQEIETLRDMALAARDADTSEPNYSFQDGVATGYAGSIYWLSRLDRSKS